MNKQARGREPADRDGDVANRDRHQRPIDTLIPGHDPVQLVAYNEKFRGYYPHCEPQTKQWMCETVGSDWICIDAGANVGYYSVLMGRLAPRGSVYAFEPTSNADLLRDNLIANGSTNVELVEMALAARTYNGADLIYETWGEPAIELDASFVTVDRFVQDRGLSRLDLMKIDVDGFDLEVLWGAEETLARFSPRVVVELNHALATRGHSVPDALEWMAARGYQDVLVLDGENFAFCAPRDAGHGQDTLKMQFETGEPLIDPSSPSNSPDLEPSPFELSVHKNNGAHLMDDGSIELDGPAWSYAADLRIAAPQFGDRLIAIEYELREGSIGVFQGSPDGASDSTEERIRNLRGSHTLTFKLVGSRENRLIIRKTTEQRIRFKVTAAYVALV